MEKTEFYKDLRLADIIYYNEELGRFLTEQWKDIVGYVGIYKISDFGRVKRLKKDKIRRWTRDKKVTDKISKPCFDKDFYLRIGLYHNKTAKTIKIHRLVATHFIPNPENKPEVNHVGKRADGKEGNKLDNRAISLRWATKEENRLHAILNGLRIDKGQNNNSAKLTDEQVLEIRGLHPNKNFSQIAREYNVHQSTISRIIKRTQWKHI